MPFSPTLLFYVKSMRPLAGVMPLLYNGTTEGAMNLRPYYLEWMFKQKGDAVQPCHLTYLHGIETGFDGVFYGYSEWSSGLRLD